MTKKPWQVSARRAITRVSDQKKFEHMFAHRAVLLKLPTIKSQFRYANSLEPANRRRDHRADFCFPDFSLLIEVDGGIWMKGGGAHSHPIDIERNMRKQNDAALLGFTVLRFTPQEVMNGKALAFTYRVLWTMGFRGNSDIKFPEGHPALTGNAA